MSIILEVTDWESLLKRNDYSVVVFTEPAAIEFWQAMKPEMELVAEEYAQDVCFAHVDSTEIPKFLRTYDFPRYPVICFFVNDNPIKVVNDIRGYYGLMHDIREAFAWIGTEKKSHPVGSVSGVEPTDTILYKPRTA